MAARRRRRMPPLREAEGAAFVLGDIFIRIPLSITRFRLIPSPRREQDFARISSVQVEDPNGVRPVDLLLRRARRG